LCAARHKPQYADLIGQLLPERKAKPMTSQSLETLRNRKLIARTARLGPRRERIWRTTQLFLDNFGLDSPATMNHRLVADTLHGIRRTLGTAQTRKKPLTRDRIVKLLGVFEGLIAAARDKALVLIGFAGSLRRSELAALWMEHLAWHSKVMHCPLRRARITASRRRH
jgi:integrase